MTLLDTVVKTGYNRAFARPLTAGDRAYLAFHRLNPGEFQDVGAVLFLDGPVELADLRAHIADRVRQSRALMLTDRLETVTVRAPDRRATHTETHWVSQPDMDVDAHVVAVPLPTHEAAARLGHNDAVGDRRIRAAVDEIATWPTDMESQPWKVYLLCDPAAGPPTAMSSGAGTYGAGTYGSGTYGSGTSGSVVVYRTSHIAQDGAALYRALHLLFGGDDDPDIGLPTEIPRPRAADYLRFVNRGLNVLSSTRVLDAWGGRPCGPARHTWTHADLGEIRAAARRHNATVNDVYLAALAGAIRAWSEFEWRHDDRPVHALMPVSIRLAADQNVLSNFTSGVRVALPCGEPDAAHRVARIAEVTGRLKGGGIGLVEHHLFPSVAQRATPRMLSYAASFGGRTHELAMVATNARTIRGPLDVAGRKVLEMIGTGPLLVGRQHLSVALFGVGDRVGITFAASDSVPNHERLASLWRYELDELNRLAPIGVQVPLQRRSVPSAG
ncbi:diacylglycerol O-acyltransferase / wax synthase [Frankia sp. AiPs1]|uniref:WS/DGAT domain-containing protein n=1 Tax=Frankia sp. AiPa1 TaxID=573492 RepID=UPI00202B2005|nr:WS/DGAT domain-containing protein [Frankia sp. AiPa1]MCL9760954.1 WS/DGAT domain-containing protein [Frankia sp. AiPa1]